MNKKRLLLVSLIFFCILCGCQKEEEITQEKMNDFFTISKLQTMENEELNQEWINEIQKQLLNQYGLTEVEAKKQIKNSIFELCGVEYGGTQAYNEFFYPYSFSADMLIWKTEDYYTVCQISNREIGSVNENITLIKEKPDDLWDEGEFLLKVLPINQSIYYTMGARASFKEKDKEKMGPFTIVQSFYMACP
ncbi:hypothetical protein [Aminipila sp.]|uniref:hypothetical protein n=1 Tax=Aminipila sp. TaxID=2060095 RepID=UPI0028A2B6DB|nr:hypothetical protein [Aminipila sp.]